MASNGQVTKTCPFAILRSPPRQSRKENKPESVSRTSKENCMPAEPQNQDTILHEEPKKPRSKGGYHGEVPVTMSELLANAHAHAEAPRRSKKTVAALQKRCTALSEQQIQQQEHIESAHREARTSADRLQKQADEWKVHVLELEAELESLHGRMNGLEAQGRATSLEVQKPAEADAAQAGPAEADEAQGRVTDLEAEIGELQARCEELSTELAHAQEQKLAVESQCAEAGKQAEAALARVVELEGAVEKAQQDANEAAKEAEDRHRHAESRIAELEVQVVEQLENVTAAQAETTAEITESAKYAMAQAEALRNELSQQQEAALTASRLAESETLARLCAEDAASTLQAEMAQQQKQSETDLSNAKAMFDEEAALTAARILELESQLELQRQATDAANTAAMANADEKSTACLNRVAELEIELQALDQQRSAEISAKLAAEEAVKALEATNAAEEAAKLAAEGAVETLAAELAQQQKQSETELLGAKAGFDQAALETAARIEELESQLEQQRCAEAASAAATANADQQTAALSERVAELDAQLRDLTQQKTSEAAAKVDAQEAVKTLKADSEQQQKFAEAEMSGAKAVFDQEAAHTAARIAELELLLEQQHHATDAANASVMADADEKSKASLARVVELSATVKTVLKDKDAAVAASKALEERASAAEAQAADLAAKLTAQQDAMKGACAQHSAERAKAAEEKAKRDTAKAAEEKAMQQLTSRISELESGLAQQQKAAGIEVTKIKAAAEADALKATSSIAKLEKERDAQKQVASLRETDDSEIEQVRGQVRELMTTMQNFKQENASLVTENRRLNESLGIFEDDLEQVSTRHAQLIGHVNPKQKLRYTLKLKDEKNQLRAENDKLRGRLTQLEGCRSTENLYEALVSLGYGGVFEHAAASTIPSSSPGPSHRRGTAASTLRTPSKGSPAALGSASHLRSPLRNATAHAAHPIRKLNVGGGTVETQLQETGHRCRVQERALERVNTDFQHLVSLIERAVLGAGGDSTVNFAGLLQKLRSMSSKETVEPASLEKRFENFEETTHNIGHYLPKKEESTHNISEYLPKDVGEPKSHGASTSDSVGGCDEQGIWEDYSHGTGREDDI